MSVPGSDELRLVFEHRGLYRVVGEVPDAETLVPLGAADVKPPGRNV